MGLKSPWIWSEYEPLCSPTSYFPLILHKKPGVLWQDVPHRDRDSKLQKTGEDKTGSTLYPLLRNAGGRRWKENNFKDNNKMYLCGEKGEQMRYRNIMSTREEMPYLFFMNASEDCVRLCVLMWQSLEHFEHVCLRIHTWGCLAPNIIHGAVSRAATQAKGHLTELLKQMWEDSLL